MASSRNASSDGALALGCANPRKVLASLKGNVRSRAPTPSLGSKGPRPVAGSGVSPDNLSWTGGWELVALGETCPYGDNGTFRDSSFVTPHRRPVSIFYRTE